MRKYALCIGNNNYQGEKSNGLQPLQYSVADAKAVAEKLKELGFVVDFQINLDGDQLKHEINQFTDKMLDFDAVLLYYSGHGFQIDEKNVLVPIDFDATLDKKDAYYSTYPLDDLMHWLNKVPDKVKIIILDACREDYTSRGMGTYFVPMSAPPGALIAFSTSPKQKAIERNGHGVYTRCLLNHLDDVRITIEEMFKRVRKELAFETKGKQISWEHTSLIDDFMLKRNAIYDGMNYSDDALADGKYIFLRNSQVAEIVEELKSKNWYRQGPALKLIYRIDFDTVLADDLFVLGRNIYQAACGNCNECTSFITKLKTEKGIPVEAKEHILNGMVFELYYNHEGKLRQKFKNQCVTSLLSTLESPLFLNCQDFISSRLFDEDRKIFYIPGQDNKVEILVKVEECGDEMIVVDIVYEGNSIFYDNSCSGKPNIEEIRELESLQKYNTKHSFEADLRKKLCISSGYLKVAYEGGEIEHKRLILPAWGYNLCLNNESDDYLPGF